MRSSRQFGRSMFAAIFLIAVSALSAHAQSVLDPNGGTSMRLGGGEATPTASISSFSYVSSIRWDAAAMPYNLSLVVSRWLAPSVDRTDRVLPSNGRLRDALTRVSHSARKRS